MKLSISVSEQDVQTIDDYVRTAGLPSRSAAVQHAIRLLSQLSLEDDYAAAWDEWDASGDRDRWEITTADGLVDAAR